MSTPKMPGMPTRKGSKKVKDTEAKKTKGKGTKKATKSTKSTKSKKSRKSRKSRKTSKYEDEEYANFGMAMVPGAYASKGLKSRASKYADEEEYETDEEYEDEEYEHASDKGARHQKYSPADFSNAATPTNFSLILLAMLFIMIVVARS